MPMAASLDYCAGPTRSAQIPGTVRMMVPRACLPILYGYQTHLMVYPRLCQISHFFRADPPVNLTCFAGAPVLTPPVFQF